MAAAAAVGGLAGRVRQVALDQVEIAQASAKLHGNRVTDRRDDPVELEIGLQHGLIERIGLLADLLGVVAPVRGADRAVLQECVREQKLRVAQAMWLCRWRLLSRLRLGSEILRGGNLLVRELF